MFTLGRRRIRSLNFHEISEWCVLIPAAAATPPVEAVRVAFLSDFEQREVFSPMTRVLFAEQSRKHYESMIPSL